MKPLTHAKNSARKFGGKWEDYIHLHEWMDSSKEHLPDLRHRSFYHHSWGIYQGQEKFGVAVKNSDGRDIAVRDILEQHVIEDMGFIPTVEHWFKNWAAEPWMGMAQVKSRLPVRLSLKEHNIEVVD